MSSLAVGVDEFTLVLQPPDKVKILEWPDKIDEMLEIFLRKSRLEDLFGKMGHAEKVQAGYTAGVTCITRPWYLTISWNEDMPNMGICVRYSAHAYAAYKQEYQQRYHTDMNIGVFLNTIQDDAYNVRLSRIDLTADYFDYTDEHIRTAPLSPDTIYTRLKAGNYVIKDWKGHQSVRNISGFDKDGAYQTFYAGSQKGKTNGFLRCYDKKAEQLQTMGFRYDDALNCESWVRFEAVFRHDYAHQITDGLKSVTTTQELLQTIANYICGKYQFFDVNNDALTEFSDDLMGIATGANIPVLNMPSPRDNTLKQSFVHLRSSSGLYTTLFKALEVWGPGADKQLMDYLWEDYGKYKDKLLEDETSYKMQQIKLWKQRHAAELRKQSLSKYLGR